VARIWAVYPHAVNMRESKQRDLSGKTRADVLKAARRARPFNRFLAVIWVDTANGRLMLWAEDTGWTQAADQFLPN
jgi:hypothetical protein